LNNTTFYKALDLLLVPLVYPSAFLLKHIRRIGVKKFPFCKRALLQVGVFPIRNHYYEPLFDGRQLRHALSDKRRLPGIDWNVDRQLAILKSFTSAQELCRFTNQHFDGKTFFFGNGAFESGDAEYLYNIIRLKKPKCIIEVGSGYSTLMAVHAVDKNKEEDPGYVCEHICIEPYERPWLESLNVTVLRSKVEDVDRQVFSKLGADDLLFIDSSHMIRPQGDVLFEILELFHILNKGVIVHLHDIFSPADYPEVWVLEDVHFWNEQYLLEAFLSCNKQWAIIGALNFLHHEHHEALKETCPFLDKDREPGSFYIQKIA